MVEFGMSAMNRTLLLSLMLAILLSVLTVSAITLTKQDISSMTALFVSPSSVTTKVNQTFEVSINVSSVSDLYGWEFKLGYNTSLLEIVNFTEGSFLNSIRGTYFVPKVMSADGYILAGCTSLRNVAGVNGNGTLATVEFRAKTLGSCTLDLYDTKIVNSAKQLVEHSEVDGSVTASGCVVIRVKYKDGYPRSGAYVLAKDLEEHDYDLGNTNETGYIRCGLPTGIYSVRAYWPGPTDKFGPDADLDVDSNGDGSTTITKNSEITPPAITILSPQNQTYPGRNVPLIYSIYDYSSISWTGYSLDGQANKTLNGNTTLNLSSGSYNIVVYSNDTYGNMGSSGKVHFTVRGGCVVIRVQYLDGYPRSGANVRTTQNWEFADTNETGYTTCCGFAPGHYYVYAKWPPSTFFAGPVDLDVDENGDGSTTIQKNVEITPPAVNILSPQNQTYINSTIPLTYTIYDFSSISWVGYSLDGQANVTLSGNTTLFSLSNGHHNIVVYANDSFGNMGKSNRIFFAVGLTNLSVKTFGPHEINGVTIWIDAEYTTYYSPINIEVGIGWHTVKVSYGFLELGPEEGSYIKYSFYCWDNGFTNNTRSLQLEKDRTIWAFYKWKTIYLW